MFKTSNVQYNIKYSTRSQQSHTISLTAITNQTVQNTRVKQF